DFHRVHGILGDYPTLLRVLGFVVDLEVPYTPDMPAEGIVELIAPEDVAGVMLTERTRYKLDAQTGVFVAKERDNTSLELEDGYLSLDNPDHYDLLQVDVDGWGLKTINVAAAQYGLATAFAARPAASVVAGAAANNLTLNNNAAAVNSNAASNTQIVSAANPASNSASNNVLAVPHKRVQRANYKEEQEEVSLPTRRTTGLSVVKKDRATKIAASLSLTAARQAQTQVQIQAIQAALPNVKSQRLTLIQNPPEPTDVLYADDLVRGYRVDVYDEEKQQWYSLCQRRGRYRINKDPNLDRLINDEGYVKVSAVAQDGDDPDDLYLHETLFQWDGWSLVAEKPGMTIVPGEVKGQIEDQSTVDNERYENVGRVKHTTPDAFDLETWFIPEPGSLPKLRFGKDYRMRARTVDLAGNSLALSDNAGDMTHATERSCYIRYEPVPSPVVVMRSLITEGEGLERLVLRSNYNQTPAQYIQDGVVQQALSGYDHTYLEVNERHIAPPKTSQNMAELHGAFEAAMGAGKDYTQWFNIAVKESGTFNDPVIVDTATGQKNINVPGIQLVTPPGVPPAEAVLDLNDLNTGDPLGPGQYVIHTSDELMLPYLPDVVARGASFIGLPGMDEDAVFHVSFDNQFPEARCFRIRVIEGEGEPVFYDNHASGARVLEVKMQKGDIRKVRMSCFVFDQDIDHFECGEVISGQSLEPAFQSQPNTPILRNTIAEGRHWMITPWRELTFVHAVQQPLMAPHFQQIDAVKAKKGDTFVHLYGQLNVDVKSTGRLDFIARWRDPEDKLSRDQPRDGIDGRAAPRENTGRVAEMPIEPYYSDAQSLKFPISPSDPNITESGGGKYPHIDQYLENFYKHEFGDTKHRTVSYFLTGATRFRDYLPQEIYNIPAHISREGAAFEVNVLSSARPKAPKVLYVVPTFGWERSNIEGNLVSRRCGGGLRIYLDRPWYSSGEGELLGVVLKGTGISAGSNQLTAGFIPVGSSSDDPLRLLTTQWGMDPVWRALPPPKNPALSHFPDAIKTQNGLSFVETDKGMAAVAGHEVHFDEDRKLWYCDITVDTGDTYFPFMRLALARYQPDSIKGVHLSPVFLTDFIQTVPDRVAAINFLSDTEFRVMVSGPIAWNTHSNKQGANESDPDKIRDLIKLSRHVTATLEKQVGDADSPWVPVSDALTDVTVEPHEQIGARMIWMKSMQLPSGPGGGGQLTLNTGQAPGASRYRVSVKEFEILNSDPGKNERFPVDSNVGFRMVYADSIELSR
ncbi:MAG: hypothetical protein AB8G77_12740, partial [Rhodothermales bacterium]